MAERTPGGKPSKMRDGRWRWKVELPQKDGKRQSRVVYGNTKKEVADKHAALIRQIHEGITVDSNRTTVAAYLLRWLEHLETVGKLAPSTLQKYREDITNHVIPAIGHIKFVDLTEQHVQGVLNKMKDRFAEKTIRNVRAVLRKALNTKEARRYHRVNPAGLDVELPASKVAPRAKFTPTPEQVRAILAMAAGHRDAIVFRIGATMGFRIGEVTGLQKSDLDLDTGTINVAQSLRRRDGALQLGKTKTSESKALLHVPPVLAVMLRRMLDSQNDAQRASPYLFTTPKGTPIEPHNINRHLKIISVRLGIALYTRITRHGKEATSSHMSYHAFRRFVGTQLARGAKADVKTAQGVLRHTSAETTLEYYIEMLPEEQRSALDSMDRLLGEDRVLEMPKRKVERG